jgi:hypothetical protein
VVGWRWSVVAQIVGDARLGPADAPDARAVCMAALGRSRDWSVATSCHESLATCQPASKAPRSAPPRLPCECVFAATTFHVQRQRSDASRCLHTLPIKLRMLRPIASCALGPPLACGVAHLPFFASATSSAGRGGAEGSEPSLPAPRAGRGALAVPAAGPLPLVASCSSRRLTRSRRDS